MSKIEIEIPDGKKAEWVNGVLTLVDDKPQDITERIKTFEDACEWCEQNNKMQLIHEHLLEILDGHYTPDLIAYLKLRIITCALNEGWEPKFEEEEERWYVGYHKVDDTTYVSEGSNYWVTTPNRLMFKSARLAEYTSTQFADFYADFFGCKKGGKLCSGYKPKQTKKRGEQ